VVEVYDPWVDADEAAHEYDICPIAAPQPGTYDAIIIAVAHEQFKALGAVGIRALGKPDSIIYDVKYVLPRDAVDGRL
jgi:UDP-N-acetyl-D-galactosamine dehydrogenase